MTISEFFHSKQPLAVACPTEDQAKKLLQRFDAHGYKWSNSMRYTTNNNWQCYKEDTCYSNEHTFCYSHYYKRRSYTIVSYEALTDDAPAWSFHFSFE